METPRIVFLIFILIFLFVSPETRSPSLSQQYELDQLVAEERYAVDLLNSSHYGDLNPGKSRWVNVTGFRREDGYAWGLLPQVQARAREISQKALDTKKFSPNRGGSGNEERLSGTSQNVSSSSGSSVVPAIYQNVTSIIRGHWARSRITDGFVPPELNLTDIVPRAAYVTNEFGRNVTGKHGDLRIRLDERDSEKFSSDRGLVREISGHLTIKDDKSSGDGYEMMLHGVHYPNDGSILLSTTSPKLAGIFALPHLTLSEDTFFLAQKLLSTTLTHCINRQESHTDSESLYPWSSAPDSPSDTTFPTPRCEYIAYLQQHQTNMARAELSFIEEELRYPTGELLPAAPSIKVSALIFSPDCGFVLESKGPPDYPPQLGTHLNGPKIETYIRQGRRCIIAFALVLCAQIFLLKRQMKDSSTPSTRSRVSFYTIAIMAMGDGFTWMGSILGSMTTDSASIPFMATAFLAFFCASFFGMKFLMDVWTVQAPEREERARQVAAANPHPPTPTPPAPSRTPLITAAGADTLPLPATARRPTDNGATPIILPPDQDIGVDDANTTTTTNPQTTLGTARQEIGALYSRFYVIMLTIALFSFYATSWPLTLRSSYANLLSFIYLSFWIPQIHRNIMRNCRKAFRWEFVIGQSLLRLSPITYIYTVENNVLFVQTDTTALLVLAGWIWLQVFALITQEILGPRVFVPEDWAPKAYDYHPVLREDADEESGASLPIGFTQASTASPSPSSSAANNKPGNTANVEKGTRIFDCAICMQALEVPIVPSSTSTTTSASTSTPRKEVIEATAPSSSALAPNIFTRRTYMVTPCRHIFHSACLEGWMRYRLQCPICRDSLPPL